MEMTHKIAKNFLYDFNRNLHSLEAARNVIDEKLSVIRNDKDRLEILRYLQQWAIDDKSEHEAKGSCRSGCPIHQKLGTALYILNQEITAISEYYEPVVNDEDELTSEEESKLFAKINDIISRFDTLDRANEVLFNEIDDLKQHFNLGRKSWQDLARGRTIRLMQAGLLETDQAKEILKSLGEALIAPFNNFLQ